MKNGADMSEERYAFSILNCKVTDPRNYLLELALLHIFYGNFKIYYVQI